MKSRNTVLRSYSVITLVVTFSLSVAWGFVLTSNLTHYQVSSHVQSFPELLALTFQDDPFTEDWFHRSAGSPLPVFLQDRLNQLLQVGRIYRIKVWSPDGHILWSNAASIIGTQVENPEVAEAIEAGKPVYEIGEVDKTENATERGRGTTLQIYVPVRQGGTVCGVAELYEDNTRLWADIATNTAVVWAFMALFGLTLYVALFAVFYRAWKRQERTNVELELTQDVTVFALALQAELRDHETGEHLERTAVVVERLARALGLPNDQVAELRRSAPLHDIGKVGIPDAILLKAGPLNAEERAIMQTHCELGDQVLAAAEARLPFRSFLSTARALTLTHHERWDGTGYPRGLKGEDIPLAGRIMAVADVYDALSHARPYKDPWPLEACWNEIQRLSGTHFDPRVVEAFFTIARSLA